MLSFSTVRAISAHIRNGQIVLDEPTELPEGAAIEVLIPEHGALTEREQAELEAACDASDAEFERGEYEDARAFAARLLARA
jgi:hypothetical protein